jgi:hypothetical protein
MKKIEGVFFDRRVLCYSFEGHPVEIITVTKDAAIEEV